MKYLTSKRNFNNKIIDSVYMPSRGRLDSKPCSLTDFEKKPNGNNTSPVTKIYTTWEGIPLAKGRPRKPSGAFLRGISITPNMESCISGRKWNTAIAKNTKAIKLPIFPKILWA